MNALIERLRQRSADTRNKALTTYRTLLARAVAGKTTAADADAIEGAMTALGLDAATVEFDLQVLRDATAETARIVPPADLDRLTKAAQAATNAVDEEKRRHLAALRKLEAAQGDAAAAFLLATRTNEVATRRMEELRANGTPRLFDAPPPPEPESTPEPAADPQAPRSIPFNAAPVSATAVNLSTVTLTGSPAFGANLQAQP